MQQVNIAKIIVLTTASSVLILLGLAFILRGPFFALLASSTEVQTIIQENTVIVTENEQLADMVEQANNSVVSIIATRNVPVYEEYFEEFTPFGGMFGDGFRIPRLREQGTEEREVGGGTGFIVSGEGYIITNRHVVSDQGAEYRVVMVNGESYDVEVLATDSVLDIAVIKIDSDTEFPYLDLGDSDTLRLGQTVVAIGNALAEFDNSVSVGVVSGLSRSVTARDRMGAVEQLDQVIQTDAAINLGNSGGPLLNIKGQVIGMNVAASLQAQNIGFAIPVNIISRVVDSVIATGEIKRPFLGVRYTMITPRIVELNDLEVDYGALIIRGIASEESAVLPESPAAIAGLQEGDIILSIDGNSLENNSLAHLLRLKDIDQEVSLEVWRDGEIITLSAVLTEG